jgi:hypothetical protein
MDIKKIIKEKSSEYTEENDVFSKELMEMYNGFMDELNKTELIKLFLPYEYLMAQETGGNIEKAYEDGFKDGLKLIKSILNLGEPEKIKLKEVFHGERAS